MNRQLKIMVLPGKTVALILCLLFHLGPTMTYALVEINYDIVYVKQPRYGDDQHIKWPEVFRPGRIEPNSDLMLLHPDGSEEVLVDTTVGAVTDPFVSFDGEWVYYSLFHNVEKEHLNSQRSGMPKSGADIFRIHLPTRQIEQLTFQEFTPNTGTGNWDESNPVNPRSGLNRLGYGILNTGPAPIAGGKIIFTSNRNGYKPTKGFSYPTMQLFVMDFDGKNVTPIAPMTIGSALHPTPLMDGSVMFSSYESQGLRDQRLWGIWSIWPDGRQWQPVVSAFKKVSAFHFMTQISDGSLVVEDYYNLNNFGFGALYKIPPKPASSPAFNGPFTKNNPFAMAFAPIGIHSITPLSTAKDRAASNGAGKYSHPSAAPENNLLVAWSDGPVNKKNRPTPWPAVDSGIYIIENSASIDDISQLKLIKNDPNYNEAWPRAVVSYQDIYGVETPKQLPWLPNDGTEHEALPESTPYGLVGTSSFYKRESFPGSVKSNTFDGLDAFNTHQNFQSSNWFTQGADAGKYDSSDVWAVRILSMEPNPDRGYGPDSDPKGGNFFYNHANERLRILGEIPLRKFYSDGSPILDIEGNPDTSFLAKIPADTPFTFQTLDRNGMVLNMAQTWHQVRPGEVRNDCGGCHAHSKTPLQFESTYAASPEYQIWDLTKTTPLVGHGATSEPILVEEKSKVVNIEFKSDIRPLLQQKCVACHTDSLENPPANLILDDLAIYDDGLPGDYKRLCKHEKKLAWGLPSMIYEGNGYDWRQTNASRYVRKFQSRRSLLIWKLFGKRLDGWNNSDHPTETVPGDITTFPVGFETKAADLDFVGSVMPPSGHGIHPLTIDEKMTFARWIDLGCPIDLSDSSDGKTYGWFADEGKPALSVSYPRPGENEPVDRILFGFADAYTGINSDSLSVKANFEIDGFVAGAELVGEFQQVSDGVYAYELASPIVNQSGNLCVTVADNQGNIARVDRYFYTGQYTDAEGNGQQGSDYAGNENQTQSSWCGGGNGQTGFADDELDDPGIVTENVLLFDFNLLTLRDPGVEISPDGNGLDLSSSNWIQYPNTAEINSNTVLTFEFLSNEKGKIHAVGIDYVNESGIPSVYFFQLYGNRRYDSFANQDYHNYGVDNTWQKFSIPIGQYLQGTMTQLELVNIHSRNMLISSSFRNFRFAN